MKLILASQGFTTPEIADAAATLAGKPLNTLNVAVINEAYVGIKPGSDENWMVRELSLITQYAKGTVSFVNLRAYGIEEVAQRLEFADVIYIVGGQQLVLPKLFRETGFDTLLTKLAHQKVIMGTSAGANVLGRQITDAAYWQDQYGASQEYLAQPWLGLVDFNILPHFEREDHLKRTRQILTPLLQDNPFPLYGLTDKQAAIYDDGDVRFVGGEPVTFGRVSS
jgi:dipeptidase E